MKPKKLFVNDFFKLLLSLAIISIFLAWVVRIIYPIHFTPQNLFFSELIGQPISIPYYLIYLFGFLNLLVIWFISKIVFKNNKSFLAVLIFGLSPWFAYSIAAGSFFIYLLNLILLNMLSILIIRIGRNRYGHLLFIVSTTLIFYSHFLISAVYLIIFATLFLIDRKFFNKIRYFFILLVILCIPLIILMFNNQIGLKNIFRNQINFLSDPGLINAVNIYRGESQKANLGYVSKIVENKYTYFAGYTILKFLKNLSLSTFFTSEEKLLNFSSSPPFYFGFIFPFLYGVFSILNTPALRKYLILSVCLTLPSVVYQREVNLNRLILFAPVITFIICYGFYKFNYSSKKHRLVVYLSSLLVFIQFLVVTFDIYLREYERYQRIWGGFNFLLGNQ